MRSEDASHGVHRVLRHGRSAAPREMAAHRIAHARMRRVLRAADAGGIGALHPLIVGGCGARRFGGSRAPH
jgi:hypothetical protein